MDEKEQTGQASPVKTHEAMNTMSRQRVVRAFQLLLTVFCIALAREVSYASGSNVIVRLPFDPNLRAVCVAGTVNGKSQTFSIQTNATHCMYSASMRRHLGQYRGEVPSNYTNGSFPTEIYAAPESRIGNISMHRPGDYAFCYDLSGISDTIGVPISGIIGMNFLKQHIVGIDFDKGEVSLFRELPSAARRGSSIPLKYDDFGIPSLNCSLAGEPHSVRIHTGSDITGAIPLVAANKLYSGNRMRFAGLSFVAGKRGGRSPMMLFRVDDFSIGDFAHTDLVFATKLDRPPLRSSFVGLNYLKRFNLVFDFPKQSVYLTESRRYARKDYTDIDGMVLADMEDGRVVVMRMINEGRAWNLGIRSGDELVRVAGEKPRNSGHANQLIGKRERELEVHLRRKTDLYSVTLPY